MALYNPYPWTDVDPDPSISEPLWVDVDPIQPTPPIIPPPPPPGPPPYVYNQSVSFDGSNSYIDFGQTFNVDYTEAFSVSIWLKCSVIGDTTTPTWIGTFYNPTSTTGGWRLSMANTETDGLNGTVDFVFVDSGGQPGGFISADWNIAVNDGLWHNITVTTDTSGVATNWLCYVDSALATQVGTHPQTLNSGHSSSTNNLRICTPNAVNGDIAFNGMISQVALWYGTTLTAADAANIWNVGVPLANLANYSTPPTHWFPMVGPNDSQLTSSVFDSVGNYEGTGHSVAFVSDVPGGIASPTGRRSLSLNGESSYGIAKYNNNFQTSAFSIVVWVKMPPAATGEISPTTGDRVVLANGNEVPFTGQSGMSFNFGMFQASGTNAPPNFDDVASGRVSPLYWTAQCNTLSFVISDNTTWHSYMIGGAIGTDDTTQYYNNEWIHCVWTYDGKLGNGAPVNPMSPNTFMINGHGLYKNGVNQLVTTYPNEVNQATGYPAYTQVKNSYSVYTLRLGTDGVVLTEPPPGTGQVGPIDVFQGLLCDLAIYNIALNQAQVTELYNEGVLFDQRNASTAANLINYWFLGGPNDTYQYLYDSIGGNTFTMYGTTPDSFSISIPGDS